MDAGCNHLSKITFSSGPVTFSTSIISLCSVMLCYLHVFLGKKNDLWPWEGYIRYVLEIAALRYFMKIMAKIFVDHDNLVKVINLLTELEITGFYLIEYRGMAPNAWKNFRLSEDPDMALKAIRDQSEPGIMINTVVGSNNYRRIIDGLEDALKGKRYTIIGHEIDSIKVKGD